MTTSKTYHLKKNVIYTIKNNKYSFSLSCNNQHQENVPVLNTMLCVFFYRHIRKPDFLQKLTLCNVNTRKIHIALNKICVFADFMAMIQYSEMKTNFEQRCQWAIKYKTLIASCTRGFFSRSYKNYSFIHLIFFRAH